MKMRVVVGIDDPFDFAFGEGEGNKNLCGAVLGFCGGPDKENWRGRYVLIKLDKPFEWEGITVKELIATNRYTGDNILDIGRKELIVGIAYVKPGAKIEVGKDFRPEDVEYSFIGHIKPVKKLFGLF